MSRPRPRFLSADGVIVVAAIVVGLLALFVALTGRLPWPT